MVKRSLTLKTDATTEPFDAAEFHVYGKIDENSEDSLLTEIITAVRMEGEGRTGRAFLQQTWSMVLSAFPGGPVFNPAAIGVSAGSVGSTTGLLEMRKDAIEIPRPPLQTLTFIKYVGADGTLTTLDPATYTIIRSDSGPARVYPNFGVTWPSARAQPDAVQLEFIAGYADAASLPKPLKLWMKAHILGIVENREAWTPGQPIQSLPWVDRTLDRYRIAAL